MLSQVTETGRETFCSVFSYVYTHSVCILIMGVGVRGQKSLGGEGLLFVYPPQRGVSEGLIGQPRRYLL